MTPQVVIVGRPNVGKSSLFNWLIEKRIAIEDPTAGVTRDRLVQRVELDGRVVDLVDTGGMGFDDPDGLTAKIDAQIESGLADAALVLLLVDVRTGLLPADLEVARRVRRGGASVLLVANKADAPPLEPQAHEFAALGFGPPLAVSAREHRNRGPLVEAIVERLPERDADEPLTAELPEMKLAMVGRRNVGKSTFVNALAHEDRVITSPLAGTTRDSVFMSQKDLISQPWCLQQMRGIPHIGEQITQIYQVLREIPQSYIGDFLRTRFTSYHDELQIVGSSFSTFAILTRSGAAPAHRVITS